MNTYNIIYSSSDEYAPYCLTSMLSLLTNNTDLERIRFFVLSNGISDEMKNLMTSFLETEKSNIIFIETEVLKSKLKDLKFNFNISSFLRIFIPDIMPKDIEKALFIDSDTLVFNGIKELYETNIEEKYCAAVLDQPIWKDLCEESKISVDDGIINAGVLLLNIKLWREDKVKEQILEFYFNNGANFKTDDQAVINAVCRSKMVILPYKYNAMRNIFYFSYKKFYYMNYPVGRRGLKEYNEAKTHPVIVHFNSPDIRPWEKWCAHPMCSAFREEFIKHTDKLNLKSPKASTLKCVLKYIKHKIFDKIESTINYSWKGE